MEKQQFSVFPFYFIFMTLFVLYSRRRLACISYLRGILVEVHFNLPLSQGQLFRLRPLRVWRTKTALQSLTDESQTRCGSLLCL